MSEWTRDAIAALGPVTDVPTTASIFKVDRETVYGQIRRNEWTVTRVLRMGRKIRIPTRDLIEVLYGPAEPAPALTAAPPDDASPCHHESSSQVRPYVGGIQSQSECGCHLAQSADIRTLRGA